MYAADVSENLNKCKAERGLQSTDALINCRTVSQASERTVHLHNLHVHSRCKQQQQQQKQQTTTTTKQQQHQQTTTTKQQQPQPQPQPTTTTTTGPSTELLVMPQTYGRGRLAQVPRHAARLFPIYTSGTALGGCHSVCKYDQ
jgi:hypothetical protein